jgi:hypothetical protein
LTACGLPAAQARADVATAHRSASVPPDRFRNLDASNANVGTEPSTPLARSSPADTAGASAAGVRRARRCAGADRGVGDGDGGELVLDDGQPRALRVHAYAIS